MQFLTAQQWSKQIASISSWILTKKRILEKKRGRRSSFSSHRGVMWIFWTPRTSTFILEQLPVLCYFIPGHNFVNFHRTEVRFGFSEPPGPLLSFQSNVLCHLIPGHNFGNFHCRMVRFGFFESSGPLLSFQSNFWFHDLDLYFKVTL